MDETQGKILDLVQAAVDLANSVVSDIKDMRYISDDTVLALSQFKIQHDSLVELLDVANEVQ